MAQASSNSKVASCYLSYNKRDCKVYYNNWIILP